MSNLFSQTLRDVPAEADITSHQLLLRAGFIRQLAAGVFSYLPLARRSLTKIENILREEMDRIGGQEITMPLVHPAELWKETGRWYQIGDEMGRFNDRTGRDMVLAMTHEEVVADLVRKEVRSYRQLPLLLYHVQTKWRDDPRPRAGLIRVREFTMKDSYSLDTDWHGLEKQYRAHYQAYFNIFHRCGLEAIAVKSDTGMMGGRLAHEFMYLTPIGEDTILICGNCGYAANRQIANFKKISTTDEDPLPLEKVATPECKSIADLAAFLEIPESRTAKAVFMTAKVPLPSKDLAPHDSPTVGQQQVREYVERFLFAIVRGDMEVNETKLINAIRASEIRPATEDEIRAVGAEPGYASPVGLEDVFVVVDDIIPESPNLVAGANLDGHHLINVNYGRDYHAQIVGDIAAAQDGDSCPVCEGGLQAVRGVEVGNIFQLGTKYSQDLGATYQDREGNSHPVVMGSYGIGSGRLLACIAEEHNDDNGLVWPISVAPYQVHLIVLSGRTRTTAGSAREGGLEGRTGEPSGLAGEALAENLYQDLRDAGIEVLYDDRPASPGVKLKDADLIGIPIRVTVSQRAHDQGGVEYKRRDQQAKQIIPTENLVSVITGEISELHSKINRMVTPVAYPG